MVTLSELIDQLPERRVLEPELLGDFLLGSLFEEHGTERFVTPLVEVGRLGKELPEVWILHHRSLWKCQLVFCDKPSPSVKGK